MKILGCFRAPFFCLSALTLLSMKDTRQIAIKSAIFGIVVNLLMAIVKGVAGIFGNSFALIADAIESTTDIFSSTLVLIGVRYSTKPADKNHPYGHGRAEALFTFVVVGFLVVSATVIGFQSILNIQTPHKTPEVFTLYVLGGIIFFKEIAYQIVKKKGIQINSSVLKAEAWHHRSDAISSAFAFVGISIAIGFGEGFEIADDIAALIASFFILYNAYKIFRPALGEIMDEHLFEDVELTIRKVGKTVEGVIEIEKCFIRKVGMNYHIDIHVVVDGRITVEDGHFIAHELKNELIKSVNGVSEVFTHVEPHHYENN
jgi:cation diffusion facilitator family transporter